MKNLLAQSGNGAGIAHLM